MVSVFLGLSQMDQSVVVYFTRLFGRDSSFIKFINVDSETVLVEVWFFEYFCGVLLFEWKILILDLIQIVIQWDPWGRLWGLVKSGEMEGQVESLVGGMVFAFAFLVFGRVFVLGSYTLGVGFPFLQEALSSGFFCRILGQDRIS